MHVFLPFSSPELKTGLIKSKIVAPGSKSQEQKTPPTPAVLQSQMLREPLTAKHLPNSPSPPSTTICGLAHNHTALF